MWTSVESPVGPLRVIAHRDAVTAIEFEGPRETGLSARSSVSRAAARSLGQPVGDRDDTDPLLAEVRRQLDAYFARELKVFDLPLRPRGHAVPAHACGTSSRRSAWGETATYGEIAGRLGMTGARVAGGRDGQRPQPDPDRDPVPPRGRRRRHADRVRRRGRAQAALLDLETDALF